MVTKFQSKVYELLKQVPKGKVTTYKIIAENLNTKAYRAVGSALRCNPFTPEVPCHKVVKSDGSVGGFMGKTDMNSKEVKKKVRLLRKEGIKIKENKILNFDKVLFRF